MEVKMLKVTTIVLVALFMSVPMLAAESAPILNNGKKWRIGYYEGGPFSDYTDTMRTLVKGLIELGWIEAEDPPDYFEELPKPYWDWLVQCNSAYLAFKKKDSYSAQWDENLRTQARKEMLKKLVAGELDLVIAMGTWAGLDLANNEHAVPVMVLSTSDPIRAGIIQSADTSGYAHVTARVDPTRYLRQIRMFHRIVGFNTLGLAYENTPDGRIYSAMSEVHQIALERGFKVVSCEVTDTTSDLQAADHSCMSCYHRLADQADAIYVTALACVDRNESDVAKIFRAKARPSFSMMGSKFVKKGIMLSISSDSGYKELGRYNAKKFGAILNGTQPSALNQVFEDPLNIAVNLETIRQIGFDMPSGILKIASEIYEK